MWRKRRDENSGRGWRGLFAWRMDRAASSRVPWAGSLEDDEDYTRGGRAEPCHASTAPGAVGRIPTGPGSARTAGPSWPRRCRPAPGCRGLLRHRRLPRGRAAGPSRRDHLDDFAGPDRRRSRRRSVPRLRVVRRAAARQRAAPGHARSQRGQQVPARRRPDHRGPSPGQRHLPRRRDRLPAARRVLPARRPVHRPRRGQPQRHLREPGADRGGRADRRGRGADRQVPAAVPDQPGSRSGRAPSADRRGRGAQDYAWSALEGRGAAWT